MIDYWPHMRRPADFLLIDDPASPGEICGDLILSKTGVVRLSITSSAIFATMPPSSPEQSRLERT